MPDQSAIDALSHAAVPPPPPAGSPPAPPRKNETGEQAASSAPPRSPITSFAISDHSSGWLVSLALHVVLLVLLSLILSASGGDAALVTVLAIDSFDRQPLLAEAWDEQQVAETVLPLMNDSPLEPLVDPLEAAGLFQASEPATPLGAASASAGASPLEGHVDPLFDAARIGGSPDWMLSAGGSVSEVFVPGGFVSGSFVSGGGLEGRTPAARRRLAAEQGGTAQSESAVEAGLRWIAAHQRRDGGWHFDHRDGGVCDGRCRNAGSVASTTGATAMALLPFLGAGYTHQQGSDYERTITRALYYLMRRTVNTPHGADLQEGTMYAQGLATLALCEAYAMTGDLTLRPLAQSGIDFIVHAQHPQTGGWRYLPGQPGDTTVLGWQLMALRSGAMAGLDVPRGTVYAASRFLDRVQLEDGAYYGYLAPEKQPTTTSVGLLCRMYTGWDRHHAGLEQGVAYLAATGPKTDNMYYNYYATQVLHHWGGDEWHRWNRRLREHLIATQARSGHETGSWYFAGGHAPTGGRLYNTAMAVMTLEVYYRYMPLYTEAAVPGSGFRERGSRDGAND